MPMWTATRFSVIFRLTLLSTVLLVTQRVQAQFQWDMHVGAQSRDKGRQALAFLPNEIWIHAGDSVTWHFDADEIHTVTFLKSGQTRLPYTTGCPGFSTDPATFDGSTCVSTPPMVKGQSFTVDFPAAGNFKLVCLVHADMTAVVHVLSPAQALPHPPSFYDLQADDEAQDMLADVGHDMDHGHHHSDHVTAGVGEVSATGGGSQTLSVMRFLDATKTIHAGETVEWTNLDPVTPHTITFGTEPLNPMPPSANVTVDADGARHVVVASPSVSAHSGFIVAAPQDRIGLAQSPIGATRFRVTFPNAGIFPYICALHDDLGMKGTIVVKP
ncbi:MAG: cupredoxin domain-containing protein [Terriglobales bacterium]